jgi:hypothetical protein
MPEHRRQALATLEWISAIIERRLHIDHTIPTVNAVLRLLRIKFNGGLLEQTGWERGQKRYIPTTLDVVGDLTEAFCIAATIERRVRIDHTLPAVEAIAVVSPLLAVPTLQDIIVSAASNLIGRIVVSGR